MLARLSGFYMVVRLDLWDRFLSVAYLWMHAMVAVWLFTLMLFVAEPLFLDRWLLARAKARPEATFGLIERLHWILLVLSLITLIGAVLGSHGVLIIRISAPRTTATARLVFKRIVAPASARSPPRPTRLVCIFLIIEGCPLIWINAAVISSGQNSVRKT